LAASTWFVSADRHLHDPAETHVGHAGDLPTVYLVDGLLDEPRLRAELTSARHFLHHPAVAVG
jgi:hypothetical protein